MKVRVWEGVSGSVMRVRAVGKCNAAWLAHIPALTATGAIAAISCCKYISSCPSNGAFVDNVASILAWIASGFGCAWTTSSSSPPSISSSPPVAKPRPPRLRCWRSFCPGMGFAPPLRPTIKLLPVPCLRSVPGGRGEPSLRAVVGDSSRSLPSSLPLSPARKESV